jgi:16S rRNA (guanine527-N7)-methyltransferase
MMEEILRAGLAELGLSADDTAMGRFQKYYDCLVARNTVMNLTAITGEEETARLHFLDCCALLGAADFSGKAVIDVGTGAGFPGLPLKIMRPDIRLTLLDSQEKRMAFLRETCAQLSIDDVVCITARAEEAPKALRAGFGIAVSRAVARLNVLCELCLPFVGVGGVFIAMKGPDCAEEVAEAENAIGTLGGRFREIRRYTIPGTDITHAAVVIEKTADTPPAYPRRWAKLSKQPL